MVAPSTAYSTSVRVDMSAPLTVRAQPWRSPPRAPIPRLGTAGVKASQPADSAGCSVAAERLLQPPGRLPPGDLGVDEQRGAARAFDPGRHRGEVLPAADRHGLE